jgi:competence protein ComEC
LKIILAFIFGLTWEFVNFLFVSSWELPKNFEGQNITVAGFVTSLPEFKAGNQFGKKQIVESFDFSTTEIAEVKQRTKIILNWYDPSAKVIAGDKWQFKVRLKRPHGIKNLGGFDFEKYLLQNKIRASGYIVSGNENIFLNDRSAKYFLMKLRQKLREKALLIFDQSSISGIIIALILGDESGIDKKQWQVFRDTGTSYLLAISGLHIGLVALAVYYLFGFIWKSFPRLVLFYPTTKAATFLGMIAAFFYGALSGFSIPTQRALIMLALFALGILQSKEIIAYRSLLLALFFVLLIDPFSPLMVGFWLSFAAVAFIIFVSSGRKSLVNSWWKKYWRMQIAVTLGLLPLSLLLFGQVSFISLFANLFALPLVCSVIVPISLIGFLILLFSETLSHFIFIVALKLMGIVFLFLEWLSRLPFLNWHQEIFHNWILAAAVIGMLLLLVPRGFSAKWCGLIWILPLIFVKSDAPKQKEVWFTVLDVGQGLATVIQTEHHVLLYDTGPKFFNSDAGETAVLPFLQKFGIKKIDALVVSHGDDDHIGGADSILAAYKIQNIYTGTIEKFPERNAQFCTDEKSWSWDGINFKFIYPGKDSFMTGSSNYSSCVLRIDNGINSVLLTGDIGKAAEDLLVKSKMQDLPASVLVVPHHGSATSSSAEFVNAVRPFYAVVSAGYLNHFHFPTKIVVDRYLAVGSSVFNTAITGAITFKFDNKSKVLPPTLYREIDRHYWDD